MSEDDLIDKVKYGIFFVSCIYYIISNRSKYTWIIIVRIIIVYNEEIDRFLFLIETSRNM